MKKLINIILLLGIFGVCPLAYSGVESLGYILNHSGDFNEKKVTVKGEVIGNILKDDKRGAWVNILDAGHNIGIYTPNPEILKGIKRFGAYGEKGDIIEVEGVFYKDFPLRAGRGIYAYNVKVVKEGYSLKDNVSPEKELMSFVLSIICLTLAVIYFIKFKYAGRS